MDGHGWTVDGTRYVVTPDETFTDWGDPEGEPILCTADSVPWQEELLRLAERVESLRVLLKRATGAEFLLGRAERISEPELSMLGKLFDDIRAEVEKGG